MVQHELFIEENQGIAPRRSASLFSGRQFVLTYDRVILLCIGILILLVLIYSFGYERGEKRARRELKAVSAGVATVTVHASDGQEERRVVITETRPERPVPVQKKTGEVDRKMESVQTKSEDDIFTAGRYTIQIATVLSQSRAEEEVELLEKEGLVSFFVERGRFFEVCIGSFNTVASARDLLERYHASGPYFDAFIRPNPLL